MTSAGDSDPLHRRINPKAPGDAVVGEVYWSAGKSLWWTGMLTGWVVLGTIHFSWSAALLFVGMTGAVLCLGHSLGMHRKLIHDGFACSPVLERSLVYLGTLVGLGGPFTMMRTHDYRDWAQRQGACHDYFAHRRGLLADFWWQIHCDLALQRPPAYCYPDKLMDSGFYRLLERTAMLQQVPPAILLLVLGGWGWVAWGVCGRVTVSIFGHWLIGHLAHRRGHRDWHVEGAAVQGHNVRFCGLVTFGECWHNNHHAFPGSARLGLYPGQLDPGWLVLLGLSHVGLVSDLRQPGDLPRRPELQGLTDRSTLEAGAGLDAAPLSRKPYLTPSPPAPR